MRWGRGLRSIFELKGVETEICRVFFNTVVIKGMESRTEGRGWEIKQMQYVDHSVDGRINRG